jgi:putative transposase
MGRWQKAGDDAPVETTVLMSHTAVPLTRTVAFRFALDPTGEQTARLFAHAGAARFAYNHHLNRVRANLDQRRAEASYGTPRTEQTPTLSWSKVSFISEFNAWKTGRTPDSPVNPDGSRGLAWRGEVSQDVFECASVNAAQALANFANSVTGARAGKKVGFPRFKKRDRATPAFKLRSKSKPGETAPVRVAGPKGLRFPTLGVIRVHGATKRVRRMLVAGRLHLHGASFRFERGRWWVSLHGVAAAFHPARRAAAGRHERPAGLDVGLTALAVVADTDGAVLHRETGVKALQHALAQLRRANQARARTKPGSRGRRRTTARLRDLHARVAHLRGAQHHALSKKLATGLTRLTVEDLNVAGMVTNRSLARAISDAGLGTLHRQLQYKAAWYGIEIVEAEWWYPSSKTCSGCGHVKDGLTLAERVYRCDACGLELDRDVNAAINLARWPDQHRPQPAQPSVLEAA